MYPLFQVYGSAFRNLSSYEKIKINGFDYITKIKLCFCIQCIFPQSDNLGKLLQELKFSLCLVHISLFVMLV